MRGLSDKFMLMNVLQFKTMFADIEVQIADC